MAHVETTEQLEGVTWCPFPLRKGVGELTQAVNQGLHQVSFPWASHCASICGLAVSSELGGGITICLSDY